MVSGKTGVSPSQIRRIAGFRDTLRLHGLPINEEWVLKVPPTMVHGREATGQLLSQHPQITALFAYNDFLALGALRACSDLGRTVPDDCAIVGFDDIQLAAMVTPALTTVSYDKYGLGQMAMNRLLEMLGDSEATFPTIELEVKLVVRESA
jgi:LacI family transcriptional regulator